MEAEDAKTNVVLKTTKVKTPKQPGMIYLSRIPHTMRVKKLREILSSFGELGRVYLQPLDKGSEKKKFGVFTEGWVEFMDKKIAKIVAATLNNSQIGGKRRHPWYHELWNIKYLPKFKWIHLHERLAYERQVHRQKLRTEIAQAKKETNFYIENVEKSKVMQKVEKRRKKKEESKGQSDVAGSSKKGKNWEFKQNEPETDNTPVKRHNDDLEEVTNKRIKHSSTDISKKINNKAKPKRLGRKPQKACENKSFLKSLFSGGLPNSDTGET